VVLTGLADSDEASQALRSGAQDYVDKTKLNPEMLVRICRYCLVRNEVLNRLRSERDRAQTLLDLVGFMIVAVNADERVALVNRETREILGLAEEKVVGQNWFDSFVERNEREERRATFARAMSGEAPLPKTGESTIITRHGEERTVIWREVLLREANGEVTGVLAAGLDATK
jgi:PAS domain S-box-containing protein